MALTIKFGNESRGVFTQYSDVTAGVRDIDLGAAVEGTARTTLSIKHDTRATAVNQLAGINALMAVMTPSERGVNDPLALKLFRAILSIRTGNDSQDWYTVIRKGWARASSEWWKLSEISSAQPGMYAVEIEHDPWFYSSTAAAAPIQNPSRGVSTSALTIQNDYTAGSARYNIVGFDTDTGYSGDLPSWLLLRFKPTTAATTVKRLYIGLWRNVSSSTLVQSAGTWSSQAIGAGSTATLCNAVAWPNTSQRTGNVRIMLRMGYEAGDVLPGSGLQWTIDNGLTWYDVEASHSLQPGPFVELPVATTYTTATPALGTLTVKMRNTGVASSTIPKGEALVLPADQFVEYRLTTGVAQNESLYDEGKTDTIWIENSGGTAATYKPGIRRGVPLTLPPLEDVVLALYWEDSNGKSVNTYAADVSATIVMRRRSI